MTLVNEENIKDVDFEEVVEDKKIRGSILYYSTNQVATILGESDSKIRYYSNIFEDILNIEVSNKQRRYKQTDIDKLKFMLELKDEGMTLKQIKEYCQEVDFENTNDIVVKESNPLSLQAIAKALMDEQSKQISQLKEDLKTEIIETMKYEVLDKLESFYDEKRQFELDGFEILKSDIERKVNDTVMEKLDDVGDNVKRELDIAVADIKKTLDIKYVPREEYDSSRQNKSWFSKIFK